MTGDPTSDQGDRRRLVATLREQTSDANRSEAVARARARGRLTVRESLALLCDDESLQKYGTFAHPDDLTTLGEAPGDGLVTGTATIDERPVAVAVSDYSVKPESTVPRW